MSSARRHQSHPQSAPGAFYVIHGECLSCGAPHAVAPDLIGWADDAMSHCVWKKQPETPDEWDQAFAAFEASEIGCYRYAGTDPAVAERIGFEFCDHPPPLRSRPHSFQPACDSTIHLYLTGNRTGAIARKLWTAARSWFQRIHS